jgi:hypothetical protein
VQRINTFDFQSGFQGKDNNVLRYAEQAKNDFSFCFVSQDNESQGVHVPCHEYCVNLYLSLDLNLWLLITVYL